MKILATPSNPDSFRQFYKSDIYKTKNIWKNTREVFLFFLNKLLIIY
jgi:hypothetical protein